MPRISGVDIPADKPIRISLRYIFGLGPSNSEKILKELGIDGQRRAKDLTEEELAKIISPASSTVRIWSKALCGVTSSRTSPACATSAATVATATVAPSPSAANARVPMPVPARARAKRSPARRALRNSVSSLC